MDSCRERATLQISLLPELDLLRSDPSSAVVALCSVRRKSDFWLHRPLLIRRRPSLEFRPRPDLVLLFRFVSAASCCSVNLVIRSLCISEPSATHCLSSPLLPSSLVYCHSRFRPHQDLLASHLSRRVSLVFLTTESRYSVFF